MLSVECFPCETKLPDRFQSGSPPERHLARGDAKCGSIVVAVAVAALIALDQVEVVLTMLHREEQQTVLRRNRFAAEQAGRGTVAVGEEQSGGLVVLGAGRETIAAKRQQTRRARRILAHVERPDGIQLVQLVMQQVATILRGE